MSALLLLMLSMWTNTIKSIRKAKRRESHGCIHNVCVYACEHYHQTPPSRIRLAANSTIHVISLNKACNFAILPGVPSFLPPLSLSVQLLLTLRNLCALNPLRRGYSLSLSLHNPISLSCVAFVLVKCKCSSLCAKRFSNVTCVLQMGN